MRYLLISIILLTAILNVSAQQNNEQYYYALDGSKWKTEAKRDSKEDQLWNIFYQNVIKLRNRSNLDITHNLDFNNQIKEIRKVIDRLRTSETQVKSLFSTGFLSVNRLRNKGIVLESARASNGEEFSIKEASDIFNILIEFYTYTHNMTRTVNDIDPNHLIDYSYLSGKLYEKMEKLINELETAQTNAINKLNSITEFIEKEEKHSGYYAFDGTAHSTTEDRDDYEQNIFNKLIGIGA